MPKPNPLILFYVFAGGALGTLIRYLIELVIGESDYHSLYLTAIVNLLGAFLLGLVSSHPWFQSNSKKAFYGTGLLGGFTTMSGLALLTGDPAYFLAGIAVAYWLFATLQLILGIVLFALGRQTNKARNQT